MNEPTFDRMVGNFEMQRNYAPFEPHTANSKWQFCNCKYCQDKRHLIESMPGKRIDFATYRRSDEKY